MISGEEAMNEQLYGRRLKPSYFRDMLVRSVVVDFHAGASPTMRQAHARMAALASLSTFRAEVEALADMAVLVVSEAPGRNKGGLLLPTQRTVDFYNRRMEAVKAELRRMLGD